MLGVALVACVLWIILPWMVVHYRVFMIPNREREVASVFCGECATAAYCRLFAPEAEASSAIDRERIVHERIYLIHSWRLYLPPLVLLGLVSGVLVWLGSIWVGTRIGLECPHCLAAVPTSLAMAAAGAFTWSTFEVYSRLRVFMLTPKDLYEIVIRLAFAIPIGYAASLAGGDLLPEILAFGVSAFPLRELRLAYRRRGLGKLKAATENNTERLNSGRLALTVDGISDETLACLEDDGISTYFDIAYADPIRVMARSGLTLRQLLGWIDQALLAVYAPDRAKLEAAGVPCALDVADLAEWHITRVRDPADPDKETWIGDVVITDLARRTELSPDLLCDLVRRVEADPHVQMLSALWSAPVRRAALAAQEATSEAQP